MPDPKVTVSLRYTEALHRRLAEEAKRSTRSLNSEVVHRLKISLERAVPDATDKVHYQ
jgi:predicted HicB family RNase H-like nuclease